MKKILVLMSAATLSTAAAQNIQFGLTVGSFNGPAGEVSATFNNVGGSQLGSRLSLSYGLTDPFTGNPRGERGSNVTFSLDGVYGLGGLGSDVNLGTYLGVRYNLFSGSTDGGTVTSNQFGFGGGVLFNYPVASTVAVIGDLGVDKYLKSSFNARMSDGTSGTLRPGETGYADVDAVVNQPDTVFKARLGVAFSF